MTRVTTAVVVKPTTKAAGSFKATIVVPKNHAAATGTVTVALTSGSTTHTATGVLSAGVATIPVGAAGQGHLDRGGHLAGRRELPRGERGGQGRHRHEVVGRPVGFTG